jgi:predicted ATPase
VSHPTALYDPEKHRSHAFVYGADSGVLILVHGARALWLLGFPDQALNRSDEALALARKIGHPFSLAYALSIAAWIHKLRREWQLAAEHAEAAVALSADQGFAEWLLVGAFHRGWAVTEQGRTDEGIVQMHEAVAVMPSRGRELGLPYFLAALAAACGKAGRTVEALALVAEALALVERHDERHWEAEIYRLKGELLLRSGRSSEAETYFHRAIDIARHQSAKSLELRATTSLARLLDEQGRKDEARRMLGEIYGWFTEGFDTADLKDAKALLDTLS